MAKQKTKVNPQTFEMVGVNSLHVHPANPRQGDVGAIYESIEHNGFYGAIIVQRSSGAILAGNHRYMAAVQSGITELPVLYVDVDDDRALRILLADNRTNDKASYDNSTLAEILSDLANTSDLLGTGYDGDDLDELIAGLGFESPDGEEGDSKYVVNVDPPVYEPRGDKPAVSQLYDETATKAIIQKVNESGLPDELKVFLTAAAFRHTVIRFDRVAEYYAHAPADVQRLFEDQALVIVDLNSAIAKGWAKMTKQMQELYEQDDSDA